MDNAKELFALIGTYGFPICVTVYLLWERYTLTLKQTESLNALSNSINMLTEYIKGKD